MVIEISPDFLSELHSASKSRDLEQSLSPCRALIIAQQAATAKMRSELVARLRSQKPSELTSMKISHGMFDGVES